MGNPQPGLHGTALIKRLRRRCFMSHHVSEGRPTASILRYIGTAATSVEKRRHIQRTTAPVAGLSALLVAVDRPQYYNGVIRPPDFQPLREGERIYTFDMNEVAALSLGYLTDLIDFEGREWKPHDVDNDLIAGLVLYRCSLDKR